MRWPSRSDRLGSNRSISSGPYQLIEYYSQRAFDRDFRAATTRGPQRGSRVGVPWRGPHRARLRGGVRARGPHRARLRGGVRAERPGSNSEETCHYSHGRRPRPGRLPRRNRRASLLSRASLVGRPAAGEDVAYEAFELVGLLELRHVAAVVDDDFLRARNRPLETLG